MVLTKKVMILFDPDKYKKLEIKAKLNHKSVGALIRETVDSEILRDSGVSRKNKLEAARRIISAEDEIAEWEEIEKLIARGHMG